MPMMEQARVPLVIATSAGQDFVDASGVGGDQYAFKTIPSEVDIARGLVRWLVAHQVKSVAIVADGSNFPQANAVALAKVAQDAGLKVTDQETIAQGTTDFHAYEASGWNVPMTGRIDFPAALAAVSPQFLAAGGLSGLTSIAVFTPALDKPGVQKFVAAYEAHYGLVPTQRSFFVYEATYIVVDAIRRAGSDKPAAIERALKNTKMPSLLGGTYVLDDHNHAHTPLQIMGLRDGQPAVIATE